MECKHCGAEVGIEYRLCPYCRSEMEYPTVNQQPNQPIIIQNIIQNPTADQNYHPNYNQNYYQNDTQNYNPNYNQNYNQNNIPNYNPNYNTINAGDAAVSSKSKTLTLILAIVLGLFGIHRFYAGRYISGAVYLFTRGFFYVGWIVDIVMIITGKFKDSQGLPILK